MYLKPSFFIVGERKCGTSSLYRYLVKHPNVLPCKLKEPNFFGKHSPEFIHKHIRSYWELFPPQSYQGDLSFAWPELDEKGILFHEEVHVQRQEGGKYITGEGSANTFFEADPSLLHQYLPDIQLILLFRDPVDRAFSHHRMYQRFQTEGRELGFRVRSFEEDMRQEMEGVFHEAYLAPGKYIIQLKKWMKVFPSDQMHIYFTEELANPAFAQGIMRDIQGRLRLPYFDYGVFLTKKFNQAPLSPVPRGLRNELVQYFAPFTEELEEYMGRKLPWHKSPR